MKTIKQLLILTVISCICIVSNGENLLLSKSTINENFPGVKVDVVSEYQAIVDSIPGVRKIKDILIYQDTAFYASFPSVIKRPNGEILVAFRRAPDRKIFGEKGTNHVDPNSYLVMVRSRNNGETWTWFTGSLFIAIA